MLMKLISRSIQFGVVALLLSSCAHQDLRIPSPLPEPHSAVETNAVSLADEVMLNSADPTKKMQIELIPIIKHHVVVDGHVSAGIELPAKKLILNSDGLPLNRFIDMALGEVLGLNYEVDPLLSTRKEAVTLHVAQPVAAERLLAMVEGTLQLYGISLLSDEGAIRVIPQARVRAVGVPVIKKSMGWLKNKVQLGRVVEFLPLYYIDAREGLRLARMFIQGGSGDEVQFIDSLNALMLVARPKTTRRIRKMIALLDLPALHSAHLRMVTPVYWNVGDLITTVTDILEAQGVPVVKTAKKRNHGVYMFPINALNAMMVLSPQQSWLTSVLSTIEMLDVANAAGHGKQTFIYYMRNGRADELGTVMQELLGQGGASSRAKGKATAVRSVKKSTGIKNTRSSNAQSIDGLNVIVDTGRNALLFVGDAGAYQAVLPLLESLDRAPRQVMIEVTIAEVSLDDSDQLGIEWQLNNVDRSNQLTGVLSTLGGLGVGSGGLTYSLIDNASNVKAQLNALATGGRTKILSTPRLLAMDGQTAKIQVGDQIPVVSQEASNAQSGGAAGVIRSFEYIDTGVILEITPTINEGGMVQIDLSQEVSEAGQGTGQNPPIFKRNVKTRMAARSGQTIVIGGMLRHTKSYRDTKIPLLGDIPLLGALFRSSTTADRSTELLVMITPHVITTGDDAEFISDAMLRELGWQEGVLE